MDILSTSLLQNPADVLTRYVIIKMRSRNSYTNLLEKLLLSPSFLEILANANFNINVWKGLLFKVKSISHITSCCNI